MEYPILNSHVNGDCTEITYKASHNISLAMQTPQGLLVPNVKDCQDKTVLEIAEDLNRLQELGNTSMLGAADLQNGTFAISNIGVIGGTYMSPIIVVPQVAIGALGALKKMPRYNANDELVPEWIMEVSWSADHRVIDGVTMAQFSNLWKSYLEHPSSMMLNMK
jgi:2-oxoisovalerate dehydrogenase E2 component (dihydrolipoyl transacylase)